MARSAPLDRKARHRLRLIATVGSENPLRRALHEALDRLDALDAAQQRRLAARKRTAFARTTLMFKTWDKKGRPDWTTMEAVRAVRKDHPELAKVTDRTLQNDWKEILSWREFYC